MALNFCRAAASGFYNFDFVGLQRLEHVMRVCRTWDSIISLMPKGGEAIWGDLDWFPEEGNNCDQVNKRNVKHFLSDNTHNSSDMQKPMKYGRIISFGKAILQLPASLLTTLDSEVLQLPAFFLVLTSKYISTLSFYRKNRKTKLRTCSTSSVW